MRQLTGHRGGETGRAAATLQMRVARLREEPRAAQVDGEHVVPVLDGQVAYRAGAGDPGVGHQRVQAAEFGRRSFHELTRHVGVAEVAHQRDGGTSHRLDRSDDLLLTAVRLVAAHGDHRLHAPGERRLCDSQTGRRADTATSAADQSSHRTLLVGIKLVTMSMNYQKQMSPETYVGPDAFHRS